MYAVTRRFCDLLAVLHRVLFARLQSVLLLSSAVLLDVLAVSLQQQKHNIYFQHLTNVYRPTSNKF